MRITIRNKMLGTKYRINSVVLEKNRYTLTAPQVRRSREALQGIPGHGTTGPLGEHGLQQPPETPNLQFTTSENSDGTVELIFVKR